VPNISNAGRIVRSRVILGVSLTAALLASQPALAAAQVPDSIKKKAAQDTLNAVKDTIKKEAQQVVVATAHSIRWYEAAGAAGTVALLTTLDQPIQRWAQRHRSKTTDNISSVFRQEGEPIYYAGVSLGVLAVGVASGSADLQRAGGRMVAAVAASGIVMEGTKMLIGRSRPNEDVGAFKFHPFTSLKDSAGVQTRGSMPSGHTTAAFAVATSLSDDIHSLPATIALYTFAVGTGYSRINDNRHWFSDTVAGAILGITTAKLINGHWKIFGLRPPGFLLTPTGTATLQWTGTF
jgi:membrane-associated phospholipid phosphatase